MKTSLKTSLKEGSERNVQHFGNSKFHFLITFTIQSEHHSAFSVDKKKPLDLTEKAEWRSDWYTTVYGNLRLRTLARRERIKSSNIIRLQLILTVVNLHIVSGRADALRHWFESHHRYTVLSYCPYKKISLFVLDRKYM